MRQKPYPQAKQDWVTEIRAAGSHTSGIPQLLTDMWEHLSNSRGCGREGRPFQALKGQAGWNLSLLPRQQLVLKDAEGAMTYSDLHFNSRLLLAWGLDCQPLRKHPLAETGHQHVWTKANPFSTAEESPSGHKVPICPVWKDSTLLL